jgi:capsular polysaccharide biosynthesis protein
MSILVLLESLSAIAAPADRSLLNRHGIVAVDQVVPSGQYSRHPASCVDTTDLNPSQGIYHQYINSLSQSFDPIHRYVLNDATVIGQGSVVTRGQSLIEDSCWEFLVHGHTPHGLVRTDASHFQWEEDYPTNRINTPSLLLKRPWWRNYGHWLVDAAALLALLRRRGVDGFEQIVIGAAEEPGLRQIFLETLSILAPGVPIVEQPDNAVWTFDQLHYVEPIHRPAMFKLPEAIEDLRAAIMEHAPTAHTGRRLFVSRRHYNRRQLANEQEIISLCERHGFEVVYPEQLSLREQAALFASAGAVVGVKGAALANIIFSTPGTSVIVLSPGDFADPFFWDIAGPRGLAYSEIFGPLVTTEHGQAQNPFTIDPDRLDALLHKVLPTMVTNEADAPLAIMPGVTAPPTIRLAPEVSTNDSVVLPELQGDFYQTCLARIHLNMRPRTYLEIGTLNGSTLALSRARSIAIDPVFQITKQIPGIMPSLFLFQGPSDEFFEACDPKILLGGAIDLTFLDGMHQFEFLLRDFMNTERYCHRDSVILLHDCIPLDLDMAGRDMAQVQARTGARHPGWWTGDVWKTVDLLMQHRPDLEITAVDAPPTGLIIVRNLDPTSTVLSSGYQDLVESYRARPDYPAFLDYIHRLKVTSTAFLNQMSIPFTDLP